MHTADTTVIRPSARMELVYENRPNLVFEVYTVITTTSPPPPLPPASSSFSSSS
jgi:hypothetical protein